MGLGRSIELSSRRNQANVAGMLRALAFLGLPFALTACLPVSTYYRAGAPISTLERDQTACEVQALRDAPVAQVVRQAPPRYRPDTRICNANGHCRVRPGFVVPGPIYVEDANAALRARATRQCMADKGYAPVSIPACPPGVASVAPPVASQRLPRLTPNSCAIRTPDGAFQIVNQG